MPIAGQGAASQASQASQAPPAVPCPMLNDVVLANFDLSEDELKALAVILEKEIDFDTHRKYMKHVGVGVDRPASNIPGLSADSPTDTIPMLEWARQFGALKGIKQWQEKLKKAPWKLPDGSSIIHSRFLDLSAFKPDASLGYGCLLVLSTFLHLKEDMTIVSLAEGVKAWVEVDLVSSAGG